jgi:putative heme-binding domain-containing protein
MRVSSEIERIRCVSIVLLAITMVGSAKAADNPFAAGVRSADPQSPSDQQASFELPEGFEIELVASEPDVAKPMNLAFDTRGRLWVTDSYEYPFAAPLDRPGKDAIKVFEDTTGDGHYDQMTKFAEGLNIPIGLYPYKNGVVAWSIPYISYFEDTDNDGRSDKQTKLYGPLGYERDTHGMNSSFTRGFDGWLYVTHGFNNNTTVRGADGSEIHMNSGNTYRIQLDGSRVEQFTYGQVNPFGMALDPLGNLYTSDCHSMPAYLLVRDAYYPSFGKPHDGLGFAPKIMEHSHESTAIDGVVYYSDNQWPVEYRDNIFIGNVMTSRVNRDTLLEVGSGKRAREEADFIKTTDSWFRPVNMQFGPDGSLYIADFYNRIIGHYEVPLQHPGRDRHRGRIWKVSFRGTRGQTGQEEHPFDLTKLSLAGIFEELKSHNLVRRQLAMNYLIDEIGAASIAPAKALISTKNSSDWQQRTHALWLLHRLSALDANTLNRAAKDPTREVRVHSMRVLSESPIWTNAQRRHALAGLADPDLNVRRAAADAFTTHSDPRHVSRIINVLSDTTSKTPLLRHTLRIALRNQLRDETTLSRLTQQTLKRADKDAIADVAVAIKSAAAANFLINYISTEDQQPSAIRRFAEHIAKHANSTALSQLPQVVKAAFANDLNQQLAILEAIETGSNQREGDTSLAIQKWGIELAEKLLLKVNEAGATWIHSAVPGMAATKLPWIIQPRRSADGDKQSPFLCSLSPGGEQFTGVIRSPSFLLPEKFSFYLAGHDGYPEKAAQGRNQVRLRLNKTGEIIASAAPPRNDTAQRVTWNLTQYAGEEAFLEVIDSDDAGAYAWLAIGRFSDHLVTLPELSPQYRSHLLIAAARIAASLPDSSLYQRMTETVSNPTIPALTRSEIATALCRPHPDPLTRAIARRLADGTLTETMSQSIGAQLFTSDIAAKIPSLVEDLFRSLPARSQAALVTDLVVNRNGADLVLTLSEEDVIPVSLLSDSSVKDQISRHGSSMTERLNTQIHRLPAEQVDRTQRIQSLSRSLSNRTGNQDNGRELFVQACQICHQLKGQGNLVGPQLDGIGNRGIERLLEDILDPNRNVDKAFHTQTVSLDNGDALSGLYRREEGNLLFLVNVAGQEFSVKKSEITNRATSTKSLMPENFSDLFEEEQISDLVTFLLNSVK